MLTAYYSLAAVNFFLGCVGITQVTRILMHQRSNKKNPYLHMVQDDGHDVVGAVKGVVKEAEVAAKNA